MTLIAGCWSSSPDEYVSINLDACSRTQVLAFSLLPAVRCELDEDLDRLFMASLL